MDPIKVMMEKLKASVVMELDEKSPQTEYHSRDWTSKKDVIHWGQRKLLMSEILFLTKYGHLSQTVVYAGSAPGKHIPYLSYMFPTHHFTLVDPNPFGIESSSKITITNDYFDDEKAKSYSGKNILFISDMRTADYRQMSKLENEQYILRDNTTQMKWIDIMKPVKSMIKFRCPYPDIITGSIPMYKGTVIIQPWAPPTSTETRLIINQELVMVEYDNHVYEKQLFHHNTVARLAQYSQPLKGEGLNNRFDSSAEIVILYDFLVKYPEYIQNGDILNTIVKMSFDISKNITDSPRTLATPMKNPEERRNFPRIDHRVFYNKSKK